MYPSNVQFLDLPNDILFIILKKLDNMDVLYALYGVDNQRLDFFLQDEAFAGALDFTYELSIDDVSSIVNLMVDRFCIEILPKMNHCVKSLIVESESMERILLAGDYPNLTQLQIFNFTEEVVLNYFTNEFPRYGVFQKQITDLILVYKKNPVLDMEALRNRKYPKGVHGYIIGFFQNLQHLSLNGSGGTLLSLHNFPLTTCSSSILSKLSIDVSRFEDCLALLDGRLKNLSKFIVCMNSSDYDSPIAYNMDDLPNLQSFSLTYYCLKNNYDTHVLPLLRRMINLKELTLKIDIENRHAFIDGTQINNQILVHCRQLQTFNFHITTRIQMHHSNDNLSSEDIRRTFTNIGYENVGCMLTKSYYTISCDVFSLPFPFDYLHLTCSTFPSIVFEHVIRLTVYGIVPFKREFFVRIARFFPMLRKLCVRNDKSNTSVVDGDQLNFVIEFSHLNSLRMECCHPDYIEEFLTETKIRLPCLHALAVEYGKLMIATEGFKRETTRNTCAKVKKVLVKGIVAYSKAFYAYFPQLLSCSRFDY